MKKNKFTEFFKGKGYYVLLFVGVIAIAAVALIGSQLSSNQKGEDQEYVDLNDTDKDIAAKDNDKLAENNPVSEDVTKNDSNKSNDAAAKDNPSKDVAGNDVEYEGYTTGKADDKQQAKASDKDATAKSDAVTTSGNTVKPEKSAVEALSFNTDEGLVWPVNGNVIMDYSMDHTTYFATLMQYKCNPAIIIDAKVGSDVQASTDGIVTAIDKDNEETGYTVTVSIGDGYNLIYGQLSKDKSSLKVGDKVKEGEVIGTVAEPTKYYTVEGSNLYFEVTKNDEAVNPMLYLH